MARRKMRQEAESREWSLVRPLRRILEFASLVLIPFALFAATDFSAASQLLQSIINPAASMPHAPRPYQVLLSITTISLISSTFVIPLAFFVVQHRHHFRQARTRGIATSAITHARGIDIEWANGSCESIDWKDLKEITSFGVLRFIDQRPPIAVCARDANHWSAYVREMHHRLTNVRDASVSKSVATRLVLYAIAFVIALISLRFLMPPIDGQPAVNALSVFANTAILFLCVSAAFLREKLKKRLET